MFSKYKIRLTLLIVSLLALGSCSPEVSDFQSKAFIKYFGNGKGTLGQNVIELTDGGYILVGTDQSAIKGNEIYVARVNKFGNAIWQKTYGSNHNESAQIVRVVNNEVFVFGTSTHSITGTSSAYMLKLSMNGDSLDLKTYGTTSSLAFNDVLVNNETFLVVGEEYSGDPETSNYYVKSISTEGVLSWLIPYSAPSNQTFKRIFLKGNGRYIAVGTNDGVINSNLKHVVFVEFNSEGSPLYSKTLEAQEDQIFADAFFDGLNIYILFNTPNNENLVLASVSSELNFNWEKTIATNEQGVSICPFNSSQIAIISEKEGVNRFSISDYEGNVVSASSNFGILPGTVNRIFPTTDNGLILIGSTSSTYGTMIQLIKTDSELFLLNK